MSNQTELSFQSTVNLEMINIYKGKTSRLFLGKFYVYKLWKDCLF